MDAYPLDIPDAPADQQADTAYLTARAARLRTAAADVLGFPVQATRQSHLAPWLDVMTNNLGDPDSEDATGLDTKDIELAVIRYLARLTGADPDTVYGYVAPSTSNAVLWALWTARRRLLCPLDPPSRIPVYLSADAHYSVRQAVDLLGMTPVVIPTRPDHAMDPALLHDAAVLQAARGRPDGILLATLGTTMWGAHDDIAALQAAARPAAGDLLTIADGALGGWIAAGLGSPVGPGNGADILLLSAHKMIIAEPAGLILARRDLVDSAQTAAYTGAVSATLGCSRSGTLAVRVWDALRALGHAGLLARIRSCVATATWAERQLERRGWTPWRHPVSTTIVIPRPPDAVISRWRLAAEGPYAHIIIGPHVDRLRLAELLRDLGPGPAAVPPVRLTPATLLRPGVPYGWTARIAPDLAYGVTHDLSPVRHGDTLRVCILYGTTLRTIGRSPSLPAAQKLIRRHLRACRRPGADIDTVSRQWEDEALADPPQTGPAIPRQRASAAARSRRTPRSAPQ